MSRPIPGYRGPIEGISPDGSERWGFYVEIAKVERLQRQGPSPKFYDLALIPGVLSRPSAVFQGLQRPEFEDEHAYVGTPAMRRHSGSIELPSPPGLVFLVFVATDHRGHIVLDWEWRKADADQHFLPLNHQSDFGRQTWPKT